MISKLDWKSKIDGKPKASTDSSNRQTSSPLFFIIGGATISTNHEYTAHNSITVLDDH